MTSPQAPRLLIFESELRAIALEASKYSDLETGGDLYGLWTHGNRPVVFLATGPGQKASATATEFQQDHEYIMECEAKLYQDFGIQYLGDWHSHHKLNLSCPSQGDINRIHRYAAKTDRERMAEIIVTHTVGQLPLWGQTQKEKISCYLYPSAYGCQPIEASLHLLGEQESPIRNKLPFKKAQILNAVWNWQPFSLEKIIWNDATKTTVEKSINIKSNQVLDNIGSELYQKLGNLVNNININDFIYKELKDGNILLGIPVDHSECICFNIQAYSFKIIDVLLYDKGRNEQKSIKSQLNLEEINRKYNSIEVAIQEFTKQ